jgi:hypothetical protein
MDKSVSQIPLRSGGLFPHRSGEIFPLRSGGIIKYKKINHRRPMAFMVNSYASKLQSGVKWLKFLKLILFLK